MNSVSDSTGLLAVLAEASEQELGSGEAGIREAETCLMELGFTHSLRICVFLEQRNSEESLE